MPTHMNARLIFLLTIVSGVGVTFTGAQVTKTDQAPFSLSVTTLTPAVKVGSDVKVDVALTSTSDKPFLFVPHLRLDVYDGEGKVVPAIKPKSGNAKGSSGTESEAIGSGGSYPGIEISPGETLHFEHILNKKFDLSKAGTYTVRNTARYGARVVNSNTITVTVVP